MSAAGSILFTLALTSIAAGGVAWAAARLADRALASPRHTVWIWRAARLAILAPILGFILASLAPRIAPDAREGGVGADLFALPAMQLPVDAIQPVMSAAQSAAEAAILPAGFLVLIVYVFGLAAAIARAAGRRIALATLLRTARTAPEALQRQAADWRRRLMVDPDQGDIQVVEAKLSPFVTGLKPVIVMPRALLGEPGAEMALAHELMHVRRGDERDRLVGEWLTTFFWFNPFAVMIERRLAGARELACDADLLDELGAPARRDYARALTKSAPIHGEARLHCAFLTDAKDLRVRRVKAILAHAPAPRGARLAAGAAGALVLVAAAPAAASAWWAAAEPSEAVPSASQETVPADRPRGVLSAHIAEASQAVQDAIEADEFETAEATASAALARDELTAYERSVLLRQRGHARFLLENVAGAIADFEAAIGTGAPSDSEIASLLMNVGQLYAVSGQYERAIESLRSALDGPDDAGPRPLRLLAQLYVQTDQFDNALDAAEQYLARVDAPTDDDRILIAHIYDQVGRPEDAASHYERYFQSLAEPSTGQILTLVNLYNDAGRPDDAQRLWDEHDMAEWARQRALEEHDG